MIHAFRISPLLKDVLIHRMESLLDGCLEDVFDESDVDIEKSENRLREWLNALTANGPEISAESIEDLELLAECLEGSTFFGVAKDELEAGKISRQKFTAYKRDVLAFSEVLEKKIGRPIDAAFS